MFKFDKHFRKRVHVSRTDGGLTVRIERQNSRSLYFWMFCLSTVFFALFCDMVFGVLKRHPQDILYFSPLIALGLVSYAIALLIAGWGAFGIEEITIQADTLRWTRRVLRWSCTRNIAIADITEIRAITPWHGLANTVEVRTRRNQQRIGDKLLHDEAIQLAHQLRQAVGSTM